MKFVYKKVNPSEISIIFSLLKEAALWLNEKGINQWQDWLDPNRGNQEWISAGLENNEFYFVEYNNDVVGMFRLQYSDEMFWGKRNERSGYIHSFTARRDYKGKGIGKEILNYIETSLLNEGIGLLRLDCSAKVKDLCRYYEDNGFRLAGTVSFNNDVLNLYEKDLRAVTRTSPEF